MHIAAAVKTMDLLVPPSTVARCSSRSRPRSCTDLLSITMNKFLKKRTTEAPAALDDASSAVSSSGPRSPGLKKSSTSRWKKNKKPEPEPKPEMAIAIELPSSDDFRTSLIMPNLSARFSMLREQDDPKSKLGKASDDSVLQPRRRSRMNEFGFGMTGLDDIAEVSSVHGSVKPPFARSRDASCTSEDGYGSDAEAAAANMMGRSRPGEGNSLFGGRQKVYKIASSGVASTRSLGKQVYEDDLGKSAFQKYRQKEREFDESQFSRPSNESQGFDFGLSQSEAGDQDESAYESLPTDSAKDLSHSPSFSAYDKKRSTTSSTARSDARSSTAATSIASQQNTSAAASPAHAPANLGAPTMATTPSQNPKNRRLYDQGLDQHMQDQQSSALTRLNSIQQQRAIGGSKSSPYLHGTKSATNLRDRPAQPVYALRSQSPTPSSTRNLPQLNTLGSLRNRNLSSPNSMNSGPQSPIDDETDALTQALEPADRGKATAMGAFNKPAHAFDEQQYLERQQQLQRANSSAVVKNKAAQSSAVQQRIDRFEHEGQRSATTPSPDPYTRARSNSTKHEPTRAYTVFQNAVNQFPAKAAAQKSSASDTHRTFFGDISASEDEEDEEETQIAQSFNKPEYGFGANNPNKWQPSVLHPVSEHPALRSQQSNPQIVEESEEPELKELEPITSARTLRADAPAPSLQLDHALDSPTLGPDSHEPLNGMVRHLRQRSNQSSVYPMDDIVPQEKELPDVPELPWTSRKSDSFSHVLGNALQTSEYPRESLYSVSNPWDLDETRSLAGATREDINQAEPSPNFYSKQQYDASPAMDGTSERSIPGGASERVPENEVVPAWQQELRKQHTRDASTATQQERDAFENELAARRNAIQESIKGKVVQKNQSRGTSPAAGVSTGGLRAFGMLRAKTSRESIGNVPNASSKAAKTLGISSANISSTSLPGVTERDGYSTESARSGADAPSRAPVITAQHPAFKQDGQNGDVDGTKHERQLASSRPLVNGRDRSRSNSTTTGRSRSRTGPYRDDLEKAMIEGTGSSAAAQSVHSGMSPDFEAEADRNGGKKNFFDAKSALAYQQMYQQNSLRTGNSGSTTPVLSPTGFGPSRSTPPLSATNSQFGAAHIPIIPTNVVRPGQLHRKKTISKSDISEPTLISSTSNVDTVALPEGASLKNGMDEPPPLPPMNPRRRGTRKLFGLGRTDSSESAPKVLTPEPISIRTTPPREYQFPPSNVVRMPVTQQNSATQQNGNGFSPIMRQNPNAFSPTASPERVQRQNNAPLDGGMF